jgi:peptidyl-prolyl cis-trans isomerase B (cyclophilin B)
MKILAASLLMTGLIACSPSTTNSTSNGATSATETTPQVTTQAPAAPAAQEKPMSYYKDKVVELKTSKGTISLRFFPEVAPNHVKNFIDLAESGFYNGTRFHRTIAGFMIQGGDPNTKNADSSSWGMGGSGKNVKAEFNTLPHKRGTLSMARSQSPDSASSQFFVVVADSRFLDNQYTVFGEVTSGMDVADAIVAASNGQELPRDPVTIESATVRDATDAEKGSPLK